MGTQYTVNCTGLIKQIMRMATQYTVHCIGLIKQIMRMATQYTVHFIGLIKQIMRMGTVDITLYRFNKTDYENGYSKQYTV